MSSIIVVDRAELDELRFEDATILTIDTGTVTRIQAYHIIAAESGVADNLDNVLGGTEGDELIIRPDAGDTITVRHNQGGAGDFWFAGEANIVLSDQDHLQCIHDGTSWCDQSGGVNTLIDHTHAGVGVGGQLDWDNIWSDAVHTHQSAAEGGSAISYAYLNNIYRLSTSVSSTLTIDGAGAVTITQMFHLIDTFGGAATDDLNQIDGATANQFMIIGPVSGARTIVVKHNVGNIWLTGGADILLDDASDYLLLFHLSVPDIWVDIGWSAGGGLALHDHSGLPEGDDLNPERISTRLVVCGPGLPNTTLGSAVTRVNALGPPALNTEWVILVLGRTTEVGAVTIPAYCHVWCKGEGSVINMGANVITMSSNSSLNNAVTLTTMDMATKYCIDGSDAIEVKLWNVVTRFTPHSSGANVGFYFAGASTVETAHCVAEPLAGSASGSVVGFAVEETATAWLKDCRADDTTNLTYGLYISSTGAVTTRHCTFRAKSAGDDVYVAVGATWQDVASNCDSGNINVLGTFTLLPQSPVYVSYARLPERAANPTNVANTGFVYTKDDGAANTELYYEDESGNVSKLTPANPAEQTNNLLTNAGHEVWQRGAGAFTASLAYCADRWQIVLAGNDTMSVTRSATKKTNSLYASACAVVVGTGAGATQYRQKLAISTSDENHHLLGQAISLRAPTKLLAGVASAVRAFITTDGTGGTTTYSSYHGNNTNWEDLDVMNVTVPSDATYVYVGLAFAASCTAYVDNCSLILGSIAVDYQGEHPAELWERCQRYYEAHGITVLSLLRQGYGLAATGEDYTITFLTRKAITPTLTKTGTWAVLNCAQPTTPQGSVTTYRMNATVTANGIFYYYVDSSDDTITAEANP